jgi:hypothetical protein
MKLSDAAVRTCRDLCRGRVRTQDNLVIALVAENSGAGREGVRPPHENSAMLRNDDGSGKAKDDHLQ